MFVEFWQKVSTCDVEEVTGSKREKDVLDSLDTANEKDGDESTKNGACSGEKIEKHRLGARVAAVEEDGEVADLLWDFMKDDCDCRCDTKLHTHKETSGNEEAIDKVVHAITNECHDANRMVVILRWKHVAVLPVHDLFNDKRSENTAQDIRHAFLQKIILGKFRNHVDEDIAKQHACRETHQWDDRAAHETLRQNKEENADEGHSAHDENAQKNRDCHREGGEMGANAFITTAYRIVYVSRICNLVA